MQRRAVVTAAWVAPVIVVGAAAPMASASPPPPVVVQADGLGCKEPGRSFSKTHPFGYRLFLDVTTALDDTITLVACTVPSGDAAVDFVSSSHSVYAALNPNRVEVQVASTNSANGTAVLTFAYNGGTVSVAVEFGGFDVCER